MLRTTRLAVALLTGLCLVGALLFILNGNLPTVLADPIAPEEGYPKLSTSIKTVTPTLAAADGATLHYTIEIRNTGAYTAAGTTLADEIPDGTTYNHDAWASAVPTPNFDDGVLTWKGDVGFDESVVISFSVSVKGGFTGTVRNTAVISHPMIPEAVTKTAETMVTDEPILTISKSSAPDQPGANRVMTYTLTVGNQGQPAQDLLLSVSDHVPSQTSVHAVGRDGASHDGVVNWTRSVTLDLGETTEFTFSVDVSDVPSGTVISNDDYAVSSPETETTSGEPYTVTVVDPILRLSKHTQPDPPGSNREMTYTLDVLNQGSLATDLVITDRVPAEVTYERGGSFAEGIVSWSVPRLDTGESVRLTYTVQVGDVMGTAIVNDDYAVCARGEGVCEAGAVVTSLVKGPTFVAAAAVDPIAHKPGGGQDETDVHPTLTVHNRGPGNALDAEATLIFERISVGLTDLYRDPPIGTLRELPKCGNKCVSFLWTGDLGPGDVITFATHAGQSTIGGEEGTPYTATVAVSDDLGDQSTTPVSDTASGLVTHFANLNTQKTAPSVIGRGQTMTYTIDVWNSGLATDVPPYPTLWDVLPISGATVLADSISHGGRIETVTLTSTGGITSSVQAISWTLPSFGTGERIEPRTFAVQVDDDLISGTTLVNDLYLTRWYEPELVTQTFWSEEPITLTGWFSSTGQPITTTIKELGLIDSYKEVTPTVVRPGAGNVLTYFLHIVNSSPVTLTNVSVYDTLPWESSTYQRDAQASAGEIVSDIVSVEWTGNVGARSSEVVTLTTLVDEDYRGPVTNTAVITHPDLLEQVEVRAVAHVTDRPVLEITKSASPSEVARGETLEYTIRVVNRGQKATNLTITDTVPSNTAYVPGTGGELVGGDYVRWKASALEPGERRTFKFAVTVEGGAEVVNEHYGVTCDEGVSALGTPVVTEIKGASKIYLPLVMKASG